MSLLVKVVFLACVLVVAAKPLTEEERQAMAAEVIGKCQSVEGASDNEVQEAIAHKPPTTRSGQCFHACVMENFGLMLGGKFSIEGGLKLAEMSGDPAKVKNSEAVSKECASVSGGDRCETASAIITCVAQTAAKLGLDPAKDLH